MYKVKKNFICKGVYYGINETFNKLDDIDANNLKILVEDGFLEDLNTKDTQEKAKTKTNKDTDK